MLRRLYDILFLFKEYVLLAFLLAVSLGLLSLSDTVQIRAIRSLTVVTVGALQDVLGVIPNYFSLRSENAILRRQNLMLSDEVNQLREATLENLRLKRLLEMKQQEPTRYVAADVIGRTLQLMRNTVTLDVGEADGVRPNMPMVTAEGLVGKVTFTTGHYAVGQTLFNRDIRVSAKVQRSRVDGIILWLGGERLVLQNVAKTLDVQTGDVVITSEYSSLFPHGIRIGTVVRTQEIPGSLFRTVEVAPAVNLEAMEEAFVIARAPDSARVELEERSLR